MLRPLSTFMQFHVALVWVFPMTTSYTVLCDHVLYIAGLDMDTTLVSILAFYEKGIA